MGIKYLVVCGIHGVIVLGQGVKRWRNRTEKLWAAKSEELFNGNRVAFLPHPLHFIATFLQESRMHCFINATWIRAEGRGDSEKR